MPIKPLGLTSALALFAALPALAQAAAGQLFAVSADKAVTKKLCRVAASEDAACRTGRRAAGWLGTDKDGVDDSSGEPLFWSIGALN